VLAFFEARHGRLYGFRWKDWLDHKSCAPSTERSATDQAMVPGASAKEWSLAKRYQDGGGSYLRPIRKPAPGSVRVAVGGVELAADAFAVNSITGVVTLANAPASGAAVTAGYEFDVPVRFDTDLIEANLAAFRAGEIPSIPVIEVRL
jgi:uncharacterized protein (TIGR02217 family)